MTTSATEPYITYAGNGSSTSFAIPFAFSADTEVVAYLITNSTNDVTAWTNPTNYSISGTNLIAVVAPAASTTLVIKLSVAKSQLTDYQENDAFSAAAHEAALDKLTRMIKELKTVVDYQCVKLPVNRFTSTTITDTSIDANGYLRIDSSGLALEVAEGTTVAVTTADLGDLDDVNTGGQTEDDILTYDGSSWIPSGISDYSASLGAVYALTPAANKLPYFTSASAAALADITSFTLTLLDDSTSTAARTTLGAAASGANTDITSVYLDNTGLKIKDSNASHGLIITTASDLTADHSLSLNTGDANRALTIGADSSISGTAYVAGGTDVPVTDGGTGASTAAGAATNLGVGTTDSPQFTAVNIGHATDTTIARVSAGVLSVEGNTIYAATGTDVPVTDGGTGLSTLTTPYGVVCAGTTATGALQNAGAGTSGQVLTSNGASTLPSFQSTNDLTYRAISSTNQVLIPHAYPGTPFPSANTVDHTLTPNILYLYPLIVPVERTLSSSNYINFNVQTAEAVKSIAFGIYADNGNNTGPTGSPISNSNINGSLAVTGDRNYALGGSIVLSKGLYWFGYVCNSTTAVINGFTMGTGMLTCGALNSSNLNAANTRWYYGYFQSFTYDATLPAISGHALGSTSTTGVYPFFAIY